MPRKKGISRAFRNSLRIADMLTMKPEIALALDGYLETHVATAMRKRDALKPRVEKWRHTIRGERPRPAIRQGASNLSVPLLIWARTAVRTRIVESLVESKPFMSIEALSGRDNPDDRSPQTVANSLGRLMTSLIMSPRAFDGREAIERAASELVDLGSGVIKIVPGRDTAIKVLDGAGKPVVALRPGKLKWEHIPFMSLVYCDGYGPYPDKMPFIGHQFQRTWSEIKAFAELGHYDKDVLEAVKAAFADDDANQPESLRNHDITELYLDWDIDGDGILEAIVIDWHLKAHKRMRTNWNPFTLGRRPYLLAQFDHPDNLANTRGQGVSEKLEGPQAEADAIHNIAIESAKRAGAHLIVLKENTRAEENFGGEEDILPGEVVVTGDPAADVVNVPLGDAAQAMRLIELEEHTRLYVTRILGLDEARVGNVEAGKRVSVPVGMTTIKEGRMIIRAAINSVSRVVEEGTYMSIEVMKRQVSDAQLFSVLTPDEIEALRDTVFNLPEEDVRSAFVISVSAQDAAVAQETRKSELMMLTQVITPHFQQYFQIIPLLGDPNVPETIKAPMRLLVGRMERLLEALLNNMESIPNPEEILIEIGELERVIASAAGSAAGEEDEPDVDNPLVGDLGGGVV